MKKNIIIALFLLVSVNLFAKQTLLVPVIGFSTYSNSSKKSELQIGIYTNIIKEDSIYEIAYEHKNTTYSTTQSDTNQNDFTFLYTYKKSSSLKYRGAIHYIFSSIKKDNNSFITLLGIEKANKKIVYGINASLSQYTNDSLTNYAYQLNPYFGIYYGEVNSFMGNFFTKISYDSIYLDGSNQNLDEVYKSFTINITQNKGKFINTLRYWTGEQLYAVKDNALTVYNLSDVYSGGFLLSTKYKFSKKYIVQLSYINEDFKTYGTDTESSINKYLISTTFNY